MILKYVEFQQDKIDYLCTVCVTDNNVGKIALTIIVSALVILGVGTWAWKKYLSNKK